MLLSVCVSPASGGVARDRVPAGTRADAPPKAEFNIVSGGPGRHLRGYVGPESLDPTKGYLPRGYESRGFRPREVGRAGIVRGVRADGTLVRAYCFDLEHPARGHMAYRFGTWSEAPAKNLGYIARTVHEYYPNTSRPAGLSESDKAAAVQAAIWFFSNRYVLDDEDPLFPVASRIVTRVLKKGPLEEPAGPAARISGPDNMRAGTVTGPFGVEGATAPTSVRVTGGEMFSDAEGTQPIASGTEMRRGAPFYVRSAEPGKLRLTVRARVVHPIGQAAVYMRDASGYPGMPREGQKIILAHEDCVYVTVEKVVEVEAPPPAPPAPPERHPSIAVQKWVHPGTYSRAGQTLHFKIKVTNTGDVALNHVRVEDHMRGLSDVRCRRTTLAAGQSMVCSASYRVTKRDLRRQSVKNCAVAKGRTFEGGMPVRSDRSCAEAYGHVPVTG
ncbi:thioester domain-containing protein [Spirillospora sp. NPDC049652]